MKLTLNRIEGLKCPEGKRDALVFDDEQRGLGVRVTAGGSKTYLAQYGWHGQKRRIPLGSCSASRLPKPAMRCGRSWATWQGASIPPPNARKPRRTKP
jgi:hypothetical protein